VLPTRCVCVRVWPRSTRAPTTARAFFALSVIASHHTPLRPPTLPPERGTRPLPTSRLLPSPAQCHHVSFPNLIMDKNVPSHSLSQSCKIVTVTFRR
jgi:hypothetical protein